MARARLTILGEGGGAGEGFAGGAAVSGGDGVVSGVGTAFLGAAGEGLAVTGAFGAQPITAEKNKNKNATAATFIENATDLERILLTSTCLFILCLLVTGFLTVVFNA